MLHEPNTYTILFWTKMEQHTKEERMQYAARTQRLYDLVRKGIDNQNKFESQSSSQKNWKERIISQVFNFFKNV